MNQLTQVITCPLKYSSSHIGILLSIKMMQDSIPTPKMSLLTVVALMTNSLSLETTPWKKSNSFTGSLPYFA